MTVREHLARLHKSAAAHHRTMAEIHGNVVAKAEGMEDNQKTFHECSKAAHDAAAGQHDGMAEECSKAAEGDLNKLIPTGVSAIAPDRPKITPVPRLGQPAIPAAANVDPVFAKLFEVDDENMERTHL
jgi:hypothetical protein